MNRRRRCRGSPPDWIKPVPRLKRPNVKTPNPQRAGTPSHLYLPVVCLRRQGARPRSGYSDRRNRTAAAGHSVAIGKKPTAAVSSFRQDRKREGSQLRIDLALLYFLVPRLCLGTHCLAGSACRVDKTRGRASHVARSQAEPGDENHVSARFTGLLRLGPRLNAGRRCGLIWHCFFPFAIVRRAESVAFEQTPVAGNGPLSSGTENVLCAKSSGAVWPRGRWSAARSGRRPTFRKTRTLPRRPGRYSGDRRALVPAAHSGDGGSIETDELIPADPVPVDAAPPLPTPGSHIPPEIAKMLTPPLIVINEEEPLAPSPSPITKTDPKSTLHSVDVAVRLANVTDVFEALKPRGPLSCPIARRMWDRRRTCRTAPKTIRSRLCRPPRLKTWKKSAARFVRTSMRWLFGWAFSQDQVR